MATLADLLRENNRNAVVEDIYRNVLGREADQSAYSWVNQLNPNDANGIADLARRISGSEEGRNYSLANPDNQWNYLESISKENAPVAAFDTTGMQYLGGNSYIDRTGNTVQMDDNGQAVSYTPSQSWYDEQLKANPDALRGYNYRNQTYLASGPLQQTMNFQGKEIPMQVAEYQVDPQTGKFIKGATGENVPVRMKDPEYNMWDDWAAPVAVIALPALVAGGAYAAGAYGAGAGAGAGATGVGGALTTTELMAGAGGAFTPAVGSGASFSIAPGAAYGVAGAGAAEGAGSAINPATGLSWEATGSGYAGNGVPLTEAEFAAQAGTGGYTAKDAYNGYKMANALKNALGGSGTSQQTGGYGSSTGGNWNYQNQPFLSNPQQKSIYATTGLDVSGNQANSLDVSRGGNLLANLLRR